LLRGLEWWDSNASASKYKTQENHPMEKSVATQCAASIVRAGLTIANGRNVAKRADPRRTYDKLTSFRRLGAIAMTLIVATSITLPSLASDPETTTPIRSEDK
jgi:hypothetical protein